MRKVVVTGVEMFRKLLDQAETGDNIGALLRGVQRDGDRERPGTGGTGNGPSAHEVQGRGIRAEEGRRRPSYAVLQRIQTAVLLQNDRRHGSISQLPEGTEMCMPGDNVTMTIELIHTDSDRRRTEIRDKRRRKNGRIRSCNGNHRI